MGPDDLTIQALGIASEGYEKRYRITRPNGRYVWEIELKPCRRVKGRNLEPGVIATILSPPQYQGRSAFIDSEQQALGAIREGIWTMETEAPS